jgi:hypothetical protein
MRIQSLQSSLVNMLLMMLIAVCICSAQSPQSGSASVSIGTSKPLLFGKERGRIAGAARGFDWPGDRKVSG